MNELLAIIIGGSASVFLLSGAFALVERTDENLSKKLMIVFLLSAALFFGGLLYAMMFLDPTLAAASPNCACYWVNNTNASVLICPH